jgi:hypothetical protein
MEEGLPKREAVTGSNADLLRGAADPSQRETKELGGGICQSYKVDIKDDGSACYKPDTLNTYRYDPLGNQKLLSEEELARLNDRMIPRNSVGGDLAQKTMSIRRGFNEAIPMSLREEVAHKLDRGIGLNVTPDMAVADYGLGKGSALSWIKGKFNLGDVAGDHDHKDLEKVGALDFLIGNTDRHGGNIIRGNDGRFYAPDNGLSFPADNDGGYKRIRSEPIHMLGSSRRSDTTINPKLKEAVQKFDEKRIRSAMKGMTEAEIGGVLRRRARLLAATKWTEIRSRIAR